MEVGVPSHRTYRFGLFELDAHSGELSRNGFRIRLQKQPLQALLLLLATPGELVARTELQRRLWATGTFVDFDSGINSALRRLRHALGDSAGNPRYVETVAQQGYRFIAAVEKPRLPPIEALAVLPFENFTGDPAQEFVANAMTDGLVRNLGTLGAVRVVSRTSAMAYKGTAKPLPVIATELKVDAVVEGAVARSGQRLQITAQLIHASGDRQLWAGSYDVDASDAGAVHETTATMIAKHLEASLRPWKPHAVMLRRPAHPKASDAYRKGRYQLARETPTGCMKALGYFHEATAREPGYARAYAGLSSCYRLLAFLGPWSPRQCMPRAEAFAHRALALDDSVAEAHASLAVVAYRFRHDWSESERLFRRALNSDPKDVEARRMFSYFLLAAGCLDEGLAEADRVQELSPAPSAPTGAWALLWTGRYDAALAAFRRARDMDSGSAAAHLGLGSALALQGDLSEGLRALTTAVNLSQRTPVYLARLGHAYATAGKDSEARAILAELRARARRRYVSPVGFALVHLALDEREAALHRLEEAYEARDFDLVTRSPRLDVLLTEPRFREVMRRVGLRRQTA